MPNRLHFDLQDFGRYVDYRFFAVHTAASLSQFVTAIAEHCHCHFSFLEDFCPAESLYKPHFKALFAQFACPYRDEQFAYSVVDKLNLVIISNKTTHFNYYQLSSNNLFSNELELFPSPNDYICYALNKTGIHVQKWPYTNVDYLLLVFVKKNHGMDDFVDYLSSMESYHLANMSNYLAGKQCVKNGKVVIKLTEDVKFIRTLYRYAEQKVDDYLENDKRVLVGKSSDLSSVSTNRPFFF